MVATETDQLKNIMSSIFFEDFLLFLILLRLSISICKTIDKFVGSLIVVMVRSEIVNLVRISSVLCVEADFEPLGKL